MTGLLGGLILGGECCGGPLVRVPAPPAAPALNLRQGLVARLRAYAPLAAIVGARVNPGVPTQGQAPPFLTYEAVSDDEQRDLSGPTGYQEARVSFGCWARDPAGCVALSSALRTAMRAMTAGGVDCDLGGVVVRWCRRDPEQEQTVPLQDQGDAKRWLFEVVYIINYRES